MYIVLPICNTMDPMSNALDSIVCFIVIIDQTQCIQMKTHHMHPWDMPTQFPTQSENMDTIREWRSA